jgi:hypothetical protein
MWLLFTDIDISASRRLQALHMEPEFSPEMRAI